MSILREAKALIEDPNRWCQGQTSKDRGKENERLCAFGALWQVTGRVMVMGPEFHALNRQAQAQGFSSLIELNDLTDHATVMAMFEKAIVELEGGL